MTPLKTPEKLILAGAAAVFVVASVLAIVQPGSLGDDEGAAPAVATTTSTTVVPETTTTLAGSAESTTSTTAPGTAAPGGPGSTIPGSGLNTPGQPSGGSDGSIDTGMESMLGPGLGLLALGMVLRRAARPQVR